MMVKLEMMTVTAEFTCAQMFINEFLLILVKLYGIVVTIEFLA